MFSLIITFCLTTNYILASWISYRLNFMEIIYIVH